MGLTDLYAGCTRAVRRNSYCKNLCLVCFGKTLATAWPEEQPKRTQSMKGRTKGSHGLSPGASRSTRTCHLHQLCLRALPQLSFPPGVCWLVFSASVCTGACGWMWGSCQHHGVFIPIASSWAECSSTDEVQPST